MKFEDLEKANASIRTTDIKGKAYAEVNERIKAFRMLYPNGTISTEIISMTQNSKGKGVVLFKATAMNENGETLGTGHAYEVEGSTFINNTSYIENAETSAVGRCLGMLGIGVDTSVASYEEVANAVKQQEAQKQETPTEPAPAKPVKKATKQRPTITEEDKNARNRLVTLCKLNGVDINATASRFGLDNTSKADDFTRAADMLEAELTGMVEV